MFIEYLPRIRDLVRVELGYVLIPHRAQLNPMQPEVAGYDLTCLFEILSDFVIDDGHSEWACVRFRC